jgi:hypothetical protein
VCSSDLLTPLLAHASTQAERRERSEFARSRYSWAVSGASYAEILRRLCAPPVTPPGG